VMEEGPQWAGGKRERLFRLHQGRGELNYLIVLQGGKRWGKKKGILKGIRGRTGHRKNGIGKSRLTYSEGSENACLAVA